MKKTRNSYFVKLPEGFQVEVLGKEELFEMEPSGIYMTWDYRRVWMHYAGEQAGESSVNFQIPSDPKYLRFLSKELVKLAKKIEDEKIG